MFKRARFAHYFSKIDLRSTKLLAESNGRSVWGPSAKSTHTLANTRPQFPFQCRLLSTYLLKIASTQLTIPRSRRIHDLFSSDDGAKRLCRRQIKRDGKTHDISACNHYLELSVLLDLKTNEKKRR